MPLPDWAPTPDDVHQLIPQRTLGIPFSDATQPTDVEVLGLITNIVDEMEVLLHLSDVVLTTDQAELAQATAEYGSAAEVERAFWPEQNTGDGSQYQLLHDRYQALLAQLKETLIGGDLPGVDPVTGTPYPGSLWAGPNVDTTRLNEGQDLVPLSERGF